ncbi:MAG: type 4a pilus biogenesis protein PilO [Nitrospirae bacterium]|nr:type 4a pilus biogenesis protein PilO [Nitrospirota bacterium]
MAIKLDIKTLPSYVKVIVAVLPSILIAVLVLFLVISPKLKQIKTLEAQIDKQNNEIAASQTKAAKLEVLKIENERLIKRINELKEQLPDEKEISSLLKQVSDMGISAGLEIKSWKPSAKKTHPSGIVYEIPVSVDVIGTYHNLGYFLSSLTKLNRIVNINNMKLGSPKKEKSSTALQVSFTAATFSAVSDDEAAKAPVPAGAKK